MVDQRVGTDVNAAIFRLNLPAVSNTDRSAGYILGTVADLHAFITSRVALDTDDTDIIQRSAGVGTSPIDIAAIDTYAVSLATS